MDRWIDRWIDRQVKEDTWNAFKNQNKFPTLCWMNWDGAISYPSSELRAGKKHMVSDPTKYQEYILVLLDK